MNWHVFGALRVRLYVLMIAVTYTIFCVNSNDFYIHIRQFKREEGKYTFRRALGNEQLFITWKCAFKFKSMVFSCKI